jgi:hypothetical protein
VCLTAQELSYRSGITSWSCHGNARSGRDKVVSLQYFFPSLRSDARHPAKWTHRTTRTMSRMFMVLFLSFSSPTLPSSSLSYLLSLGCSNGFLHQLSSLIALDKVGRDNSPASACPCMSWYSGCCRTASGWATSLSESPSADTVISPMRLCDSWHANSKLTLLMLALQSELRLQAPVTTCARDLFEWNLMMPAAGNITVYVVCMWYHALGENYGNTWLRL